MMSVFIFILLLNVLIFKISYLRGCNKNDLIIVFAISLFINIIFLLIIKDLSKYLFIGILISIFSFIIYIDFKMYLIFDEVNLLLLLYGLIYLLYYNLYDYLYIFVLFIIIVLIVNYIMIKTNKEVIGGGDLKLFVVMSLFVGGVNTMFSLTISSFLGIIYYLFNKNKMIPFGPFLSIGYFLVFLLSINHII